MRDVPQPLLHGLQLLLVNFSQTSFAVTLRHNILLSDARTLATRLRHLLLDLSVGVTVWQPRRVLVRRLRLPYELVHVKSLALRHIDIDINVQCRDKSLLVIRVLLGHLPRIVCLLGW